MAKSFADVYNARNQVHMAGLMTAPMVVIELWVMASMFKNRKLNAAVIVLSALPLRDPCFRSLRNMRRR